MVPFYSVLDLASCVSLLFLFSLPLLAWRSTCRAAFPFHLISRERFQKCVQCSSRQRQLSYRVVVDSSALHKIVVHMFYSRLFTHHVFR